MHSNLPALVFLLTLILAAVWLWESPAFKNFLLDLLAFWRQFTRITRVVVFVGIIGVVIYGGSKPAAQSSYVLDTSAAGLTLSSVPSNMTSGAAIDLTDFELAMESTLISTQSCLAGFALVKVSTNSESWFSDPQNEVVYDRWQRYGVSEDTFYLTLTNSGFSFPLGSNIYSAVHIASQGLLAFDGPQSMAGAALDPLLSEAFLAPMNGVVGIVPAEGGSLSYYISPTNFVVTWNNVYACRTNLYPISYQAELKDSGDFSYRFAFSSSFVNSAVATNFNVAAFNHGNGERYSFDATNSGVTVRELLWKAFLPVEPGVLDHDGDGLSSAAELFLYGTDISKSDTDGDGVSDYDEVMNPDIYDPLNPDSDGDSLVDSMDAQPGIYNDPSAVDPVDGYTLGFKVVHLGPAGAVMSFATDSDDDGFEDWKELLAGTLINDSSSVPVAADGITTLFSATITLAAAQPEPILLTLGGRRVMLREAGSTTLWLNEGVANTLSLLAVQGCAVSGLSITIDSPYAAYAGNDKPFNGTVRLRSGEQTKFGMVVQPVVSTASNWICFHDEPTRNARAFVLPEDCPGNPSWAEYGSNFTITDSDSMNATLNWYGAPGCDDLYFEYYLTGALYPRTAYVHVTRCAGHGSSTSSESSSAAVALNNDDDNGNGTDDRSDSTVEGENDLCASHPIYGHAQSCCPCYGYGPNPDIIATRTHCSGRVRTFTSPSKITEKTAAFPGDSVFVEGREASPTVGAEKIVWSWLEEGEAKASTNYYTVFSVRLFGDLDFDDDIDYADYAAFNALSEYGWGMPVKSNTLRKVELKTDVLIPGYKILSLSGDAQIRVWTTPNPTINDTPLLITGQTVTNGFAGANFGAYPTSMLYVESIDSGVATLTYSYVGTGDASGFGCSAELGMTAVKVEFVEDDTTDYNFSPSLGEEAKIKVQLSPSLSGFDYSDYYLKIKIVRELNGGGEQFIDWVDVDDPNYTIATAIDFSSKLFTWNGIPSAFGSSASQAQGVDVFQGISATARRSLPPVTQGQAVPPPLYTAVACIYRSNDQSVFCEAKHNIFVPQVFKFIYDSNAVSVLKEGMVAQDNTVLVEALNDNDWNTQRNRIKVIAQAYYDQIEVNVRIVDESTAPASPCSSLTMVNEYGSVGEGDGDFLNASPSDTGKLRPLGFISAIPTFIINNPTFQLPITKNEVGNFWAETAVHECAHMLGLVCPGDILNGSPVGYPGDDCGWHNQMPYTYLAIMNPGSVETISDTIGRNGPFTWKSRNHMYLKFVLPK